ncbi:MAG TPA: peptide deformylase [Thermoanaerobaculia bacterium]|jgi:peptide deformylase|nr:peptide deformylase [Thermoanaerobaculia bacterium]
MPEVLLLGDPRLRVRSAEVKSYDGQAFDALAATLEEFRRAHGFGRAISAPQIGIAQRFIAVNLGSGTFFVVNPVVTWRSEETFTMWDDCMSFPDLLVRVERARSLSLEYVDEQGKRKEWRELDQAAAELLQHEIDHLDGVLAVDYVMGTERAMDLVVRREYERNREYFDAKVDYTIMPTISAP